MTTMSAARTAAAVEIDGLTKRYGSTRAVDGVSLSTGPGVVGLLGPNGAGKTTLLRMVATVLAPDAGRLRLCGLDPARPAERLEIRRRLGYLPQNPGLYRGFTAFDLVDYVAVLKEHTDADWRRRETRRVLEAVGLADVMHRRIRTLSGGMRQRVALAAALLGEPDLLVLDEPATGLDPEQRLQLRSTLSRAAASATVLLSTHNTAEVAALCQRVFVMTGGRVQFSGTPAELAAVAAGRVWEAEREDPTALRSWVTAEGRYRHLGDPPSGASGVEPTVDDGYLLVTRQDATWQDVTWLDQP
jgi:ABC-2 type transport system ATP-binding protein